MEKITNLLAFELSRSDEPRDEPSDEPLPGYEGVSDTTEVDSRPGRLHVSGPLSGLFQ